ncbi:MAG: hypothetical protein KC931_26715, partial [Candidatus Omnitrophica bacterium]|nr:hypothetical protein [Candidatus Omnitrophota bacterium]
MLRITCSTLTALILLSTGLTIHLSRADASSESATSPIDKGTDVVHFPDSILEGKVRELIGKPSGDILIADLANDTNTTFDLNNA